MMYFHYAFIIFSLIGSLIAREASIDTNRVQRLSNEAHFYSYPYIHGRRSVDFDQIRSNDYDDNSGGISQPHTQVHILYPPPSSISENTIKVHQPREDPKLYYQSDAYLKEIDSKNINREVTAVYPGRQVIRAGVYDGPSVRLRKIRREQNRIYTDHSKCIRCPHDTTLVTKMGSDRVILQVPRLLTCSGQRASRNVRFVQMYGPKFGSLITRGSQTIIGRITYNDETLHLCKMQVHVIVQSCTVPKYLLAHCNELERVCNFTCKDSKLELQGEPSLACDDNMNWESELPVCRARSWCYTPVPTEHGHISCKGGPMADGAGLTEGSKCRIRCAQVWRPSPRGMIVCRRGAWTQNLVCQPKNRSPKV